MVGSKRPASLRSDTSLAKRPRFSNKVAPHKKPQFAEKTGHLTGSDSDSENNDEQSQANDQGCPPGNDISSTMI
jgi:hypothetical protein